MSPFVLSLIYSKIGRDFQRRYFHKWMDVAFTQAKSNKSMVHIDSRVDISTELIGGQVNALQCSLLCYQ